MIEKLQLPASSKEVDWAWLEVGEVPDKHIETVCTVTLELKRNGCKIVILRWCHDNPWMEAEATHWMSWCSNKFQEWKPSRHKVQNTRCGGPIRCTANLLLFAPVEVNQCIGPFNDLEASETLEQHLDDAKMRHLDCISGWTLVSLQQLLDNHPMGLPAEELKIEWKGECWLVFSAMAEAPLADVTDQSESLDDCHFLVSVSDSGMRHAVQPIWDEQLF